MGSEHLVCTECGLEIESREIMFLGHDFSEWTVTKAASETEEGSQERVCSRCNAIETQSIPMLGHVHSIVAVPDRVSCTEDGCIAHYQCTGCNRVFLDEAGEVEISAEDIVIPALEHDWDEPSYTWNDAHTAVTARSVCRRDAEHILSETVVVTAEVTTPATCTEMGETTYTSGAFENEAFTVQTKTLTDVEALGHDWGEVAYVWNDDNTAVTATRVCAHDPAHVETETVVVTAEVTTPATCTEMGETTYTSAAFTNPAFEAQTTVLTNIPKLAHSWLGVDSVAASGKTDGLRGGVVCEVCGEVQTANRTVHAVKVLTLPAVMRTIEDEAFAGIAAEQVTIPEGARSIGSRAFADCDSLLLVVIPASVTSIADDAFENSDVAVICPEGSYAASWCDTHEIAHNP
jgi:hypothetical protein